MQTLSSCSKLRSEPAIIQGQPEKMIIIPLGWLVPVNSLPCPPSQGLQKYHLQILNTPGGLCCTQRIDNSLVSFLN